MPQLGLGSSRVYPDQTALFGTPLTPLTLNYILVPEGQYDSDTDIYIATSDANLGTNWTGSTISVTVTDSAANTSIHSVSPTYVYTDVDGLYIGVATINFAASSTAIGTDAEDIGISLTISKSGFATSTATALTADVLLVSFGVNSGTPAPKIIIPTIAQPYSGSMTQVVSIKHGSAFAQATPANRASTVSSATTSLKRPSMSIDGTNDVYALPVSTGGPTGEFLFYTMFSGITTYGADVFVSDGATSHYIYMNATSIRGNFGNGTWTITLNDTSGGTSSYTYGSGNEAIILHRDSLNNLSVYNLAGTFIGYKAATAATAGTISLKNLFNTSTSYFGPGYIAELGFIRKQKFGFTAGNITTLTASLTGKYT